MVKYAVFQTGSRQYQIAEGDQVLLEGQYAEPKVKFDKVLLISSDGKTTMGNPYIQGAYIDLSVLGQEKGKKIMVRKYKAKSRYRRTIGHRPQLTRVKVEKIVV